MRATRLMIHYTWSVKIVRVRPAALNKPCVVGICSTGARDVDRILIHVIIIIVLNACSTHIHYGCVFFSPTIYDRSHTWFVRVRRSVAVIASGRSADVPPVVRFSNGYLLCIRTASHEMFAYHLISVDDVIKPFVSYRPAAAAPFVRRVSH